MGVDLARLDVARAVFRHPELHQRIGSRSVLAGWPGWRLYSASARGSATISRPPASEGKPMISCRRAPVLLVGVTVLLTGCTLKEQARKFLQGDERLKPVVQVGETEYTQADLDRFFDSRLSDFRDPAHADRVKSRLLETFVEERLLLHEAERRHIEPNPEALRSTIEKIEASDAEHA